ncbi:UDP-N-acetylmuramate--L-alanine ligase [bacterium]|nr:UDP-N-acetylmuramate--L-alanine ligase [bacterium]
MYKKLKMHFVGIGGVGMSGIAEVLLNLGYSVSGSDAKSSDNTKRLKRLGAKVYYKHQATNIDDAQVVVVSSAIKKDNPELVAAAAKHIPIIQRAEMLSELMRFSKYGIAVAGTHGKTTTTSLIASILYKAGLDPTMIIGGRVNHFRSNARLGKGDFMVAESDESDGSFLKLSPTIAVITNIDREHMEFYKTFDNVVECYRQFANKVPFYGTCIMCIDHPVVRELMPKIEKRVLTYGFSGEAQVMASNIKTENGHTFYDLTLFNAPKGRVTLNMLGEHNVLNSLAAFAVASELNISFAKTCQALKSFKGVHRRCEVLLTTSQVTVIDDYGHHPEEIKATIKTIREGFAGRLVTVFQPHRYSRTEDLYEEFVTCFDRTDVLIMTDIYSAGEAPIKGIEAAQLAQDIARRSGKEIHYVKNDRHVVDNILKFVQPQDIVLTQGAGDITKIGKELAKKLKNAGVLV